MSSLVDSESVAPKPAEAESTSNGEVGQETALGDIPSSPPLETATDVSDVPKVATEVASPKDAGKSDSEAETIVLPGKESDATPSKRKRIRHEGGAGEGDEQFTGTQETATEDHGAVTGGEDGQAVEDAEPVKNGTGKEGAGREGGNSSDLSSAPSSPVAATHSSKRENSNSDLSRSSPPRVAKEDGSASSARAPQEQKVVEGQDREGAAEGIDHHHDDPPKQVADSTSERTRERRETRSSVARDPSPGAHSPHQRASRDRSRSPRLRAHRKSSSYSTLNLSNGTSQKRKRAPPPLQPPSLNERRGDASSRSASPARRPHLLEHPSETSSGMSPLKTPHRKTKIDQHGRTDLARICAAGAPIGLEKQLQEHPEELDVADYAGNTPVQTASLEGKAKIVKLLIEHGCDVNCKNNDKDTPLIDAVENGHLRVVRLLLDAGANPRQGNVNGEEPIDLLDLENQHYAVIKAALEAAKNITTQRRASDDQQGPTSAPPRENGRASRDASVQSPRHSPPVQASKSPPPSGGPPRRKTVRSEVTRNDLLWMKPTTENLRDRAGKGDMAGVANILNVLNQADTESLIAAARGGHDEVMQLLLGIGGANADPGPSSKNKPGWDTPMLAAIGRGNEKVIQLLLAQPKFNPTKKNHKGLTYYEIAKERQGLHWEEEHALLKEAFDKHTSARKGRRAASTSSPESARKVLLRDKEREHKRRRKDDSIQSEMKRSPSPGATEQGHARNGPPTKGLKNGSFNRKGSSQENGNQRPTPGRSVSASQGEADTQASQCGPSERDAGNFSSAKNKIKKDARSRSDASVTSLLDSDASKPRRKLVSGKIYKDGQERQRRASVISTASEEGLKPKTDLKKGKAKLRSELTEGSQGDSKPSSPAALLKASVSDSELHESRVGSRDQMVKTEESQDTISLVRHGSNKRPRNSASPPRSSSHEAEPRAGEKDLSRKKRRRLELEELRKSQTRSTNDLPNGRHVETAVMVPQKGPSEAAVITNAGLMSPAEETQPVQKPVEDGEKREESNAKPDNKQKVDEECPAETHQRQGATPDPMEVDEGPKPSDSDFAQGHSEEASGDKTKEEQIRSEQVLREEAKQLERKRVEEEAKRQAEEERLKAEAEADAEKALKENAEKEKADRKARIAREEEEARAAERRKVEEAERQARVAEEEEQARLERRRREEEHQRRREIQERLRREEAERRRAEHEERQRLEQLQRQEEQERARREALPYALQRLAELPTHLSRTRDAANDAFPLYTVTLHQLDPQASEDNADERWVVNFQVAMVLGERDLALSRYTAWTKRAMTERQKVLLWRVVRMKLQGRAPMGLDPAGVGCRDRVTQAKFRALEPVFWIRLSDFQDITPRYSHLNGLSLSTCPMEDLSRQDKASSPFAPRTDAHGWTVTPFKNGSFESYTPAINEPTAGALRGSTTVLFRPISEEISTPTKEHPKVNGVGPDDAH